MISKLQINRITLTCNASDSALCSWGRTLRHKSEVQENNKFRFFLSLFPFLFLIRDGNWNNSLLIVWWHIVLSRTFSINICSISNFNLCQILMNHPLITYKKNLLVFHLFLLNFQLYYTSNYNFDLVKNSLHSSFPTEGKWIKICFL